MAMDIILKFTQINGLFVMHYAIWYQTLKNGIQMVSQNAVLTS